MPSSLPLIRTKEALRNFLRWWATGLRDLLPAAVRGSLQPSRLIVLPTTEGYRLELWRGTGRTAVDLHRGMDPETVARNPMVVRARRLADRARLVIPADQSLVQTVVLPRAAEENLREVLAFEMDRYTPWQADAVSFDFRVVSREAERLRIELAVVPRQALETALTGLAAWGIAPARVTLVDASGRVVDWADLLAPADHRSPVERWLTPGLAFLALILAGALVLAPSYRLDSRLSDLEARIASAQAEAMVADKLRAQIDGLVEQEGRLIAFKAERPGLVEILDDMTKRLPDDAWLMSLSLHDGEMTVRGRTRSAASHLIALLEASDRFANVRFASQVRRDPEADTEVFTLSAAVEGLRWSNLAFEQNLAD